MLLLLPSLRHLTAHMAPGPGMEALDSALLAPHFRTSGVTHLTLQHGNMTAGALTFVMHLPHALTHFSYSDAHLDPLSGWEVPMFRLALSCARETLESLTLGCVRGCRIIKRGVWAARGSATCGSGRC